MQQLNGVAINKSNMRALMPCIPGTCFRKEDDSEEKRIKEEVWNLISGQAMPHKQTFSGQEACALEEGV